MKPLLILLSLLVLLAGCAPSGSSSSASAILQSAQTNRWPVGFQAAFAQAAAESKPLLLRFTATWCGPCKVLDGELARHDGYRQESQHWSVVRSDVDAEPALAEEFQVQAVPTILLIDARTKKAERIEGLRPAATIAARMQEFRAAMRSSTP